MSVLWRRGVSGMIRFDAPAHVVMTLLVVIAVNSCWGGRSDKLIASAIRNAMYIYDIEDGCY